LHSSTNITISLCPDGFILTEKKLSLCCETSCSSGDKLAGINLWHLKWREYFFNSLFVEGSPLVQGNLTGCNQQTYQQTWVRLTQRSLIWNIGTNSMGNHLTLYVSLFMNI